jgi:hypothetical protein
MSNLDTCGLPIRFASPRSGGCGAGETRPRPRHPSPAGPRATDGAQVRRRNDARCASIYRTRKETDNNPAWGCRNSVATSRRIRCRVAPSNKAWGLSRCQLRVTEDCQCLRLKVPKPTRSCERKEEVVCYTCGCKLPYEDHGDSANIVEDDLKQAGQTETIKRAGVTAAKLNMLELLRLQEEADDLKRPKQDYS